jgi:exosortase D (VPLPA-CTERM-specific)
MNPLLIPGVLCAAALGISYFPVIEGLLTQWLEDELVRGDFSRGDFSHGLIIAPIALFLGLQKRDQLRLVRVQSDWRALPLLALAPVLHVLGEMGAEIFTVRISLILFILGATWLVYGPEVLKVLRFPLAFLFLMVPIPGLIYRSVTFPLQLLSSRLSVEALHLAGISAFREGNVIELGPLTLQIAEACSGLRFIFPLLTMGFIFAYTGKKPLWKQWLLVAAAIPIALLANVFRITGTGLVSLSWSPEAAQGFFHTFSGWVAFMLCFSIFLLLNLFLARLPGRSSRAPQGPVLPSRSVAKSSVSIIASGTAIALALATPVLASTLGSASPIPLRKPLATFPAELDGWTGERTAMDHEIWKLVGGQDYAMLDYRKPGRNPVNFYVAYYEHQRKAGGFAHSPRFCMPGSGWFIEENRGRRLVVPSNPRSELNLNELVTEKNGEKQLVYFWYQGRGRNFTSEYAAKFYMVWDGLLRRRTDGALVRLMSPLEPGQRLERTREAMDAFALAAFQALEAHLPQ